MKINQQSILKVCHKSVVPEADSGWRLDSRHLLESAFRISTWGGRIKGLGKGEVWALMQTWQQPADPTRSFRAKVSLWNFPREEKIAGFYRCLITRVTLGKVTVQLETPEGCMLDQLSQEMGNRLWGSRHPFLHIHHKVLSNDISKQR